MTHLSGAGGVFINIARFAVVGTFWSLQLPTEDCASKGLELAEYKSTNLY
ncbi:MAG: hypothetical protein M3539_16550 [Acidobacteriota bacterium]|nr:hypothetical protein [Acidobacteriota bacterium]